MQQHMHLSNDPVRRGPHHVVRRHIDLCRTNAAMCRRMQLGSA